MENIPSSITIGQKVIPKKNVSKKYENVKPTSARGYVRCSTVEQESEGNSVETQKSRIYEYCQKKGLTLVKFYQDIGITGATIDREQLNLLSEEIGENEIVVVTSISRLGRNLGDAIKFRKDNLRTKNCELRCVDTDIDFSTPSGELVLNMMLSVSEVERANISSHTKANMKKLVEEGKWRSQPPFGWKFASKTLPLEKEPGQQEVLQEILTMYEKGMSLNKISKTLNNDGKNSCLKNNKKIQKEYKFSATSIKDILMDHERIPSDGTRPPLSRRIACHRKDAEVK